MAMVKEVLKKLIIIGIILVSMIACHKKKKPFLLLPLIGTSPSEATINHSNNSNLTFHPPIGVLDDTFQGSGYKIYEDIPYPTYSWDLKSSLLIQADGKIVLGSGNGQFLIARFNHDGSLDNSFNSVGYTIVDIGDGGD